MAAEPPLKMYFSMSGPSAPSRDGAARLLLARGDINGAIDAYRRLQALDLSQAEARAALAKG